MMHFNKIKAASAIIIYSVENRRVKLVGHTAVVRRDNLFYVVCIPIILMGYRGQRIKSGLYSPFQKKISLIRW